MMRTISAEVGKGSVNHNSRKFKAENVDGSRTHLMTAKTYKQQFVDPLIKKLKEVIREVFYHYYQALDSYHRLNNTNGRLYRENEHLTATNDKLKGENEVLRSELKDFRFLRKVFGSQQIDNLIAQAKDMEQQRKQTQRTRRRNTNYER